MEDPLDCLFLAGGGSSPLAGSEEQNSKGSFLETNLKDSIMVNGGLLIIKPQAAPTTATLSQTTPPDQPAW